MVKHIVMWNFIEELNEEQKNEAIETIRHNLEVVKACAGGVVELEVLKNELPSSNKDIVLISLFESVEALNAYQIHPEHVKAASYIKTVTCNRVCFDYVV